MQKKHQKQYNQGFSLLEISIVLVIIGLLAGGILLGRDLIRASQLRSTISQITKYNTAVHSFELKYYSIPGDMPFEKTNQYGIQNSGTAVTLTAGGDGNGLIESSPGARLFIGEPVLFWSELSAAKMIEGTYGTSIDSLGAITTDITTNKNNWKDYMPAAKINGSYIMALSGYNSENYYVLGSVLEINKNGFYNYLSANNPLPNNILPRDAYDIDRKSDDGFPISGNIQAIDLSLGPDENGDGNPINMNGSTGQAIGFTGVIGDPGCIDLTTADVKYNIQYDGAAAGAECSLRIKFQ